MARGTGGYGQDRFLILSVLLFLLLGGFVVQAGLEQRGWWDPVQILAEMATSTLARASFEHQVVAFFGPEVLLPLFVRPGSGPANRFEVVENTFFPVIEALAMHVLPSGAVIIVADNANAIPQIFQVDGTVIDRRRFEAVSDWDATPGHVSTFAAGPVYRLGALETVVGIATKSPKQVRRRAYGSSTRRH